MSDFKAHAQPSHSFGRRLSGTMDRRDADTASIAEAGARLRAGALVAFPTETVYGLGANALSDQAVAAIFQAKGRPSNNPVIVHVPDMDAVAPLADLTAPGRALAAALWPGPLTLVLKRRPGCPLSPRVSAGGATVAVRVPAHPVALDLLRAAAVPVAAPSANRSGAISPTRAADVIAELGHGTGPRPALVLDGGPCAVGVESTVLDLSADTPRLLRPGGIPRETLEQLLNRPLADGEGADGRSDPGVGGAPLPGPGLLASHYAPARPLRLNADRAREGEALLGFNATPGATLDLSPDGDLAQAAHNLFGMLRALDAPPHQAIAVAPVPAHGLGLAINDRLRRAAAPRSPAPLTRED